MLETDRGEAEDHPNTGSNKTCSRDGKNERAASPGCQDSSGICAYTEEGSVAEGDLPRISDDEIESYGANRIDAYGIQYVKHVWATDKRDNTKKKHKADKHP